MAEVEVLFEVSKYSSHSNYSEHWYYISRDY